MSRHIINNELAALPKLTPFLMKPYYSIFIYNRENLQVLALDRSWLDLDPHQKLMVGNTTYKVGAAITY
jgi:hypothetical protein